MLTFAISRILLFAPLFPPHQCRSATKWGMHQATKLGLEWSLQGEVMRVSPQQELGQTHAWLAQVVGQLYSSSGSAPDESSIPNVQAHVL